MSSSEEEDYMSAAVLGACSAACSTGPGLARGIDQRRINLARKKAEADKNNAEKFRPRKEAEEENRKAGLEVALNKDNKGFQLLTKMGFRPGMGLGRDAGGRVDPVPVNVKSGRGGLGVDADRKRKREVQREKLLAMAKKRKESLSSLTEDYRSRMRHKFEGRKVASDLKNVQSVCRQLDSEADWVEPLESWYWPDGWNEKDNEGEEGEKEEEEEEEDDQEIDPFEKLEVIVDYLRTTYWYCSWCGMRYESQETLDEQCPGPSEEDHG